MGKISSLKDRRCFNHAEREAVVRCLECGNDFCRECATEHDGRMLCVNCLHKQAVSDKKKSGIFKLFCAGLFFVINLVLIFLCFSYLGHRIATSEIKNHAKHIQEDGAKKHNKQNHTAPKKKK